VGDEALKSLAEMSQPEPSEPPESPPEAPSQPQQRPQRRSILPWAVTAASILGGSSAVAWSIYNQPQADTPPRYIWEMVPGDAESR
jgi:hypothetical protein